MYRYNKNFRATILLKIYKNFNLYGDVYCYIKLSKNEIVKFITYNEVFGVANDVS